jgi:Fe-S-cluster containining protein
MHDPEESRGHAPAQDAADAVALVARLHARVDAEVAPLSRRWASRLRCGLGCTGCCSDDLTVFEVEAERIRREHPEVLRQEPGPTGACAFLDAAGACRVYAARPYVCRTQGLPLRWLEGDSEHRDICPLNDAGEPALEVMEPDACWTLGPWEETLAAVQLRRSREVSAPGAGGDVGVGLTRVALRSLFAPAPGSEPGAGGPASG